MFALSLIQENPVTNEPSIWFFSPRCRLSCKNCIMPFKTERFYTKLDVVAETARVRSKISSVVLYLGGMHQKPHIILRYLNVFRSRWNGLARYVCFAIPNLVYLWRYFNDSLLQGFIFDLHWPVWGGGRATIERFRKITGCSEREYLQALSLIKIIETGISVPDYKLRLIYSRKQLRSKGERMWTENILGQLNCCYIDQVPAIEENSVSIS